MFVTESGIFTDVRLVQFSNAQSPILVTESGIVIDISFEQPAKTPLAMHFNDFDNETSFKF